MVTTQPTPAGTAFSRATPEHVNAIVDLVNACYRARDRRGWTTEADLLDGQRTDGAEVRALVIAPEGMVILAHGGGELVGCCHLLDRGLGTARFGMFAVRPAIQGGGIGRALLSESERIARDEFGAHTMDMLVIRQRDELISWYERRGYVRTGETAPFPYGDERLGIPKRSDLEFTVLSKALTPGADGS